MTTTIDHLVYACPDLQEVRRRIAALTGVSAVDGGQHPGRGTTNALISLGERTYLELIGPDPGQSPPPSPRPFGLDGLSAPSLQGWAVAAADLRGAIRAAASEGYRFGEVVEGSRRTPAGAELSWTMTEPAPSDEPALLPFLIDWHDSPHPAASAPTGLVLERLKLLTPQPELTARILAIIELEGPVDILPAPSAGLFAELAGGRGQGLVLPP